MSFRIENIKKLIDWNSSSKTSESRQNFNYEKSDSNISGKAREEKEDIKNPGLYRKASIQILILDILFTIVYVLIINIVGLNLIFLVAGILIAPLPLILSWKNQMQRYHNLIRQPFFEYSKKMKIIIIAVPVVLNFVMFFFRTIVSQKLAEQAIFSFGVGFLVVLWLVYFQMRYWEKKNHKVIYIDKSYGLWKKSYSILEK